MKKKISLGYLAAATLVLLFCIGPLVWTFILSVTPEYEMFKNTGDFLPTKLIFDNYQLLFTWANRKSRRFFIGMGNSLRAVAITLFIGLPLASVSAYVLARMRFSGRIAIKNTLLITMSIPVFATIIPLYKFFSDFGILDNIFWLSAVYTSSFLPVTTWLIMNYFAAVPDELQEAALVDGCGQAQTFFKIFLPMSYPVLLSAGLIIFLSTWNQFQIPLILASSNATKPVSIVASEFMTKDTIQYGLTTAAGLVTILPPALAAVFFRRYLIDGMTNGAVKG